MPKKSITRKLSREQWLSECADLILNEIIAPVWEVRGRLQIKVSVGYAPNTKTNSRVIGCCLSSVASSEGYNEIFISPMIDDSLLVLSTLAHEVVHAVDDNEHGHRGDFCTLARKIGLEGKITATVAGDTLRAHLKEYIELLGDIPHAAVDLSGQKRQVNRNLKVWCNDDDCGFKFNTSKMQILKVLESAGEISCPGCGQAMFFDV